MFSSSAAEIVGYENVSFLRNCSFWIKARFLPQGWSCWIQSCYHSRSCNCWIQWYSFPRALRIEHNHSSSVGTIVVGYNQALPQETVAIGYYHTPSKGAVVAGYNPVLSPEALIIGYNHVPSAGAVHTRCNHVPDLRELYTLDATMFPTLGSCKYRIQVCLLPRSCKHWIQASSLPGAVVIEYHTVHSCSLLRSLTLCHWIQPCFLPGS
jgi:hypothetical protein